MMKMIKNLIQSTLRPFGYYLRSSRRFGEDFWQDLSSLVSGLPSQSTVIFDVGAHYGETLSAARQTFPKATIHCFEPDPESFEILKTSAIPLERVHLHPCALGSEPGTAEFNRNRNSLTNSLLPTSAESLKSEHADLTATREIVNVPITTLDAVCEREGIQHLNLLKTDCQGYDLKVLHGAEKMISSHKIDVITCEVIFDDEYDGQGKFHELMGFLDSRGYHFIGFYNMARNTAQECTFCDAVFRIPPSKRAR
jgi:FkbM family methyltransferase